MPRMRSGQQPSGKSDWETPDDLMAALREGFGWFDLDPCAVEATKKAHRHIGPDSQGLSVIDGRAIHSYDGLDHNWGLKVYVNPPYGRGIGNWVEKCYHEVERSNADLVVALLPVATDTAWWRLYVSQATEVRFLKGRVHFVGADGPAPFASAIVVWRRGMLGWHRVSYWDWKAKV